MKKSILLSLSLIAAVIVSAQDDPKVKMLESINTRDIKAHMEYLSSDYMEGRMATENSSHIAAGYIANMFTFAGLKPIGDVKDSDGNATFYHAIPFVKTEYGKGNVIRTRNGQTTTKYTHGEDYFITKSVLTDLELSGDVVFIGYGRPVDIDGTDLKGKVVVRLKTEDYEENIRLRKSIKAASPAAILTITDMLKKSEFPSPYRSDKMRRYAVTHDYDLAYKIGMPGIVEAHISSNLAADLCPNIDFAAAQKQTTPQKPQSTGRSVEIVYDIDYTKYRGVNVVGLLEGEDTSRSIVVGAHYDHVGIEDGFVFNGADDNASGVAAVISIAKAFTDNNIKPKCNIIFVGWGVEEECMLGSEQYVYDMDKYCQSVFTVVNFDMISRNLESDPKANKVEYTYSKDYPAYLDMAKNNIKKYTLNLEIVTNPVPKYQRADTDFDSFSQKMGLPLTSYFTHLHDDYHSITDDMSRVNLDKCTNIIRLGLLNVIDLTTSK